MEQIPIETLQVGHEQRVWRAFIDFDAASGNALMRATGVHRHDWRIGRAVLDERRHRHGPEVATEIGILTPAQDANAVDLEGFQIASAVGGLASRRTTWGWASRSDEF